MGRERYDAFEHERLKAVLEQHIEHIYGALKPLASDQAAQYALVQYSKEHDASLLRHIPSYGLLKMTYGRAPSTQELAHHEGFRTIDSLLGKLCSESDAFDMDKFQLFEIAVTRLCTSSLCIELGLDGNRMVAARGDYGSWNNQSSWYRGFKQRFKHEVRLQWHKAKSVLRHRSR